MDINLLFIAYARFDNIQNNLDSLDLANFNQIFIYIDGPKNEDINQLQIDFVSNFGNKVKIITHQKNMGVRDFIPYAIFDAFKYSDNLLILEDDISINNTSINYVLSNSHLLESNMIALFNPMVHNTNIIAYDGGIWGWCVSKKVWFHFSWSEESVLKIFITLLKKIGLLKSFFYAPLVYLSKKNKIKSWAYNWFYIRVKSNIKSIIPHKTMSINLGLGDLFASNTNRRHKFSTLKLSDEISHCTQKGIVPFNLNTGYTYLEIFFKIVHNWFRILEK